MASKMDPGGFLKHVGRRSATEPAKKSSWTPPDAAPSRLQGFPSHRAGKLDIPGRLRGGSRDAMARWAVPPTKYFVLRNERTKY